VWFVFLICQVKVLSWEGACCGGAVVLEMCVVVVGGCKLRVA